MAQFTAVFTFCFQATIEDVECDEGDTVRFKAVITGDPNPEASDCSLLFF